jgi:hypothetical protein
VKPATPEIIPIINVTKILESDQVFPSFNYNLIYIIDGNITTIIIPNMPPNNPKTALRLTKLFT